jgi:hypothetical protein
MNVNHATVGIVQSSVRARRSDRLQSVMLGVCGFNV